MGFLWLNIILIWLQLLGCVEPKTYIAGVVEYYPYYSDKALTSQSQAFEEVIAKNLHQYSLWAKTAAKQGAKIVVFPENGLYGFLNRDLIKPYLEPLPEPIQIDGYYAIPCLQKEKFKNCPTLQSLSCMAVENGITVVANMGDVKACQNNITNNRCPADGQFQYNTNVVLDADGAFIAKYHKKHLFFEPEYDEPKTCEKAIFLTSFGVRFGLFTCFDMLFACPANVLVDKYKVHNILMPTAWMKGIPLLQANQYQQGWSRAQGVNLIAANLHYVRADITGSGIYSNGLVKSMYFNKSVTAAQNSHLLLAELDSEVEPLPRSRCRKMELTQTASASVFTHENRTFKSEMMHNQYNFVLLEGMQGQASICYGKLCCQVSYVRNQTLEWFALAVYDGPFYVFQHLHLQVCALVKCKTNNKKECGQPTQTSATVFDSFLLSGTFSNKATLYPTALLDGIKLIQPEFTYFNPKLGLLQGCEPNRTLISAAIVGRIYNKEKHN